MSLAFVAFGIFTVLIGLEVIPVESSSIHAPYWIITYIGGLFSVFGMFIWFKMHGERLLVKRRQAMSVSRPYSKAYADYPWNSRGITISSWDSVRKLLTKTTIFTMIVIPFNWWAWASDTAVFMVKLITSLFDLFALIAIIMLARDMLAARKYGESRVEYKTFPFLTGSRVDLKWLAPSTLGSCTSITFVLRCVEEWGEKIPNVSQLSVNLVHDQIWAATCKTEGQVNCHIYGSISLSFDIPRTVPGSKLSQKGKAIFWELDVLAKTTGFDFQERYLVPVYSA